MPRAYRISREKKDFCFHGSPPGSLNLPTIEQNCLYLPGASRLTPTLKEQCFPCRSDDQCCVWPYLLQHGTRGRDFGQDTLNCLGELLFGKAAFQPLSIERLARFELLFGKRYSFAGKAYISGNPLHLRAKNHQSQGAIAILFFIAHADRQVPQYMHKASRGVGIMLRGGPQAGGGLFGHWHGAASFFKLA